MSGVLTQKFGRKKLSRLGRQLLHVLLDLPLLVAPGEVGVGLLEAGLAERVHHCWLGESLGQEEHVRIGPANLSKQPGPEIDRLGMRIVDPEDAYAVAHPELDDPQAFQVDPVAVVVEVDGVDVLVLLRRILRVRDGTVGALGEPLGMLGDPRVIRRCLEREVQRNLQPQRVGLGDEPVECIEVAEVGMDAVVSALRVRRSPMASQDRSAPAPMCCSGLYETLCRSDGSAAGRPRRSPSPRPLPSVRVRCRTCLRSISRSPRPTSLPGSGGRTRTTTRTAPYGDRRRSDSPA